MPRAAPVGVNAAEDEQPLSADAKEMDKANARSIEVLWGFIAKREK